MPESVFDVACGDLVPLEQLVGLYGASITPSTTVLAGVHEWELDEAAARNDGALWCQWNVPDSDTPAVTITATAASADDFALAIIGLGELRDSAGERILDGAYGECRHEYLAEPGTAVCTWNLYRDGVWVVASLRNIPDGEVAAIAAGESLEGCAVCPAPRVDSLSTRLVVEAAERVGAASIEPSAEAPVSHATCDGIMDALMTNLSGTVAFGRVEDLSSFEPGGGQVWGVGNLAIERQGWTRCFFDARVEGGELYFYVTVANDAAWLLTNDLPAVESFGLMASGEGVSRCAVTEDSGFCTAAMTVGAHVISLTVFESSDQALAEALVGAAADAVT